MTRPGDVLVTGGDGRLGRALASLGANALARNMLDITEAGSIRSALDKHEPSLIINAAAYTDVEGAEDNSDTATAINGRGAGLVAEACTSAGVPLIHISTDYVFGDASHGEQIDESAEPGPLSQYGASKLAGERAVSAAGGNTTIVRVSWLYDGGPDTFIDKMLKIAASRDKMMVVDDAWGRPTAVTDLALVLMGLADKLLSGERVPSLLHIGPPNAVSRFDWASEIFKESKAQGGPSPTLSRCTSDTFPTRVRHPLGLVLDTSLADTLLGPMPDWRDATKSAVRQRLVAQASA